VETAVETTGDTPAPALQHKPWDDLHPVLALVGRRTLAGIVTLVVVSLLVFLATEVLPGNAAYAILGHNATPATLRALERQLGLDRSLPSQYWHWFSGVLTGHPGTSLANGQSVWSQAEPALINSAVLIAVSGVTGSVLGVILGAIAALRRDGWFDRAFSVVTLAAMSLPLFVIAVTLIILFATTVTHILPGVSSIPPGTYAWQAPKYLILPALTLIIVVVPYIQRMMRGATIEALESDYVEMALLKGVPPRRILFVHALPNAIAPTIQAIGLNFLFLAGGIVVVEYIFNFPGIGQLLVNAVSDRDIPVIQFTVLVLAAFYLVVNIVTDIVALLATPRRRVAR